MRKIHKSGLLAKLDHLYYATMGEQGSNFILPGGDRDKVSHIAHHGTSGTESQTQSILYDYCKLHPDSKVLYFHNKGSFHMSDANIKFRFYLDCFVLTPHCIESLDTHDTCGWRISPVPTPHYSGNFWWATCKHVNRLFHPLSHIRNKTLIAISQSMPCISMDRFFAEQWVTSYPDFNPSDCMSEAIDTRYMYAYTEFPRNATKFCPTPDGKMGQPCGTAASLIDFTAFKKTILDRLAMDGCSVSANVIKRSYVWYGQPPVTYMKWMAPLLNETKSLAYNETKSLAYTKWMTSLRNDTKSLAYVRQVAPLDKRTREKKTPAISLVRSNGRSEAIAGKRPPQPRRSQNSLDQTRK